MVQSAANTQVGLEVLVLTGLRDGPSYLSLSQVVMPPKY
jgi:hypothetical protein